MNFPDKKSPLQRAQKGLYTRSDTFRRNKLSRSFSHDEQSETNDVKSDWEHDHGFDEQSDAPVMLRPQKKKKKSFAVVFLVFAVIFFIVAAGIAFTIIRGGGTVVSSRNVDVAVSGPVTIGGGETLSLQIAITNRNAAALELADLILEFPDGTRNALNPTQELVRTRESLGTIAPGEEIIKQVEAVIFGEEGDARNIVVAVEYRLEGSNAIFVKESLFEIQVESAPLAFLVDLPQEVNSGQEITASIEVISNATTPIEGVMVSVDYPFGFEFVSAYPAPEFDDDTWFLGDIEPQGRRTIEVTGTIEGQDEEERTFRFTGGLQSQQVDREIGTAFLTAVRTLEIKRPFIQAALTLNGSAADRVAVSPGQVVRASIDWQNNLTAPIEDAVITARIEGDTLNESSIVVTNGFYRSIDNTVIWDQTHDERLKQIEPGGTGNFTFEFESYRLSESAQYTNPIISVTVDVAGKRVDTNQSVSGGIASSVTKEAFVATDFNLTSRALYASGPFTNTGPMPPEVDTETTFTVIWSTINNTNDVTGAAVSAGLPSHVRWLGLIDPSTADVSYDPLRGVVTWTVGDVPAGTGYTSAAREVAFQVAMTPSVSQVGDSPDIIGQATLLGIDSFTGSQVGGTVRELNTQLPLDPVFAREDGDVIIPEDE